jgi:hypothetical protein
MSTNSITDSVFYGQGRVFYDDGTSIHEVGSLQNIDVDITIERAEFKAGYDAVVASVIKGRKIAGKAQSGEFDPTLLAKALGATSTVGKTNTYSEPLVIAATVTVAHAATFVEALQVLDPNGTPMTKVASAPAAGQFSVAAGVFSFAAADVTSFAGKSVSIDYRATVATGSTNLVSAGTPKAAQTFRLVLTNPDLNGVPQEMTIFAAVIDKFAQTNKAEAFSETSIDFAAQADASLRLIEFSQGA